MMKKLFLCSVIIFLAFINSSIEQEKLELDDIIYLKNAGRSNEEIVKEIRQRELAFLFDDSAEKKLKSWGFKDEVLNALRTNQLISDVIKWKQTGKSEDEIIHKIVESGVEFELTAQDLLKLRKEKISIDIVLAIEGKLSEKPMKGFIIYEHPARYFSIQYPADWKQLYEVQSENITVAFTPDHDKKKPSEVLTGIFVKFTILGKESYHSYLSLEDAYQKLLKFRASSTGQPEFKLAAKPKKINLRGANALKAKYNYEKDGIKTECMEVFTFQSGIEYSVILEYSSDKLGNLANIFERIVGSFNPLLSEKTKVRQKLHNRDEVVRELIDKYKCSIVKVKTEWSVYDQGIFVTTIKGHGTGFIIRKDGYILTNHHVVWADRWQQYAVNKYADKITIEYDSTLKKPSVEAVRIDAVRTAYPHVDIALLKISGDDHTPLPLTRVNPANKHVKEGDAVLALGFPAATEMEKEMPTTLTVTEGNLSKFNLKNDGTVDEIITTALIHQGNSGGPCFNLETRSVIGLNTFSPWDPRAKQLGLSLTTTYGGLVPIDTCFDEFAYVLSLPAGSDLKLEAKDYLNLGIQFYKQNLQYPAQQLLQKAATKGLADAYAYLGNLYYDQNNKAMALSYYNEAIKREENNIIALYGLAQITHKEGDNLKAIKYLDKGIETASNLKIQNIQLLMNFYLLRSSVYDASQGTTQAIADAKKAVDVAQSFYTDALKTLAKLYYKQNEHEKGKECYEQAMNINSNDTEARFGIIDYLVFKKKYDLATLETERILDKFKQDHIVFQNAGKLYLATAEKQADSSKRDKFQKRAFELYDSSYKILVNKGQYPDLSFLLDYAKLARWANETSTAEKIYAEATNSLITFNVDPATFLSVRNNKPELQFVYFELAEIYKGLGYVAIPSGFYKACININPATETAKNANKSLNTLSSTTMPLRWNEVKWLAGKNHNPYTIYDVTTIQTVEISDLDLKEVSTMRASGTLCPIIADAITASLAKTKPAVIKSDDLATKFELKNIKAKKGNDSFLISFDLTNNNSIKTTNVVLVLSYLDSEKNVLFKHDWYTTWWQRYIPGQKLIFTERKSYTFQELKNLSVNLDLVKNIELNIKSAEDGRYLDEITIGTLKLSKDKTGDELNFTVKNNNSFGITVNTIDIRIRKIENPQEILNIMFGFVSIPVQAKGSAASSIKLLSYDDLKKNKLFDIYNSSEYEIYVEIWHADKN